MKIYENISQLIGQTPLMHLARYGARVGAQSKLYAKLEYFNPAGSVKDRVALSMLEEAERSGALQPNSVIIEPTSGNTGIGLAAMAICRGYRVILTMPETMSLERRKLLSAYGAELVLTEGKLGMQGAIDKARELSKQLPNSFLAGQFTNPANPSAHYRTTGPEIWNDCSGNVDIFVAGIGTGGTISGIGRYLKEKSPNVRIIGIEPQRSAVLSGGRAAPHGLQGIGAGFIPETLDRSVIDEITPVREDDAYGCGRLLARTEGLLVGISSAAALFAATQIAKQNNGKNIVVLLPDGGERYLSTEGYFDHDPHNH
ncbi:MAG: cysteine synthase A [Ruminococcaceae bacterium]|nr:cysteine synthase A [Oscillospiraceae bacterium]